MPASSGLRLYLISRVGQDKRGDEIVHRIHELGLSVSDLQVAAAAPTGTVCVSLSGSGVPEYAIHEEVAWDRIAASPEALTIACTADAVCFGTLAQRSAVSRAAIQRLVSASSANALRVFDINLRQRFYDREIIEQSLKIANVLKLNDQKLAVLSLMFELTGGVHDKIEQLASRLGQQLVALTRAEHGSLLYQSRSWSELRGGQADVVDTLGRVMYLLLLW